MIEWEIKGTELVNCNCNYGCPCQFNAPPTFGDCAAVASLSISKGHFGDVSLDGLKAVGVMKWPGAIHEGGGQAFLIIDESASEAQRDALIKIQCGEETEPGATIWNVFAATLDVLHDPVFKAIECDIDVEARTGRIVVDGLVEVTGRPIKNPVTGEDHRARIDLPDGFEYLIAEMGSASCDVSGPIPLRHDDSYGQFAHLHLNNAGPVK